MVTGVWPAPSSIAPDYAHPDTSLVVWPFEVLPLVDRLVDFVWRELAMTFLGAVRTVSQSLR